MLKNVVSYGYESILLAVHCSVFADECKSVNIRVNNECNIVLALLHQIHDVRKVLLQWLWVMLKISCCLGIKPSNCLDA